MADRKPRISVCVANYNGEEVLPDCLDSLYRQDLVDDFEIIVHDDASTDDSVKLIQSFYPDVQLLTSDRNVGFCISNNRMVSRASGEFILLLNNDAALYPDALSTLLKEAEKFPRGAILTLPQFDWESGKLVDRGSLLDPFYNPIPNLDPERTEVAMVIGACLWIPRDAWSRLGGFPEWFGSIAEDLWLCCKARLEGIPVHALQTSGYRHRQGYSFGGNRAKSGYLITNYRRRYLSERNKTYVLYVMSPPLLMRPLLAMHLFLLFSEGLLLALFRWDQTLWKKVYWRVFHTFWNTRKLLKPAISDIRKQRLTSLTQYYGPFSFWPRKLSLFVRYGAPQFKD